MIRYGTGSIAYLNPFLNFIIYFAQMKDFGEFLKRRFSRHNENVVLGTSLQSGTKVVETLV